MWFEERARALLSTEGDDVLFLAGTASNQVKFCFRFDHTVLPSPI
ncbi:MAG: hypothetical protein WBU92_11755 [Candidatus Dormiibacterota bacterium]